MKSQISDFLEGREKKENCRYNHGSNELDLSSHCPFSGGGL